MTAIDHVRSIDRTVSAGERAGAPTKSVTVTQSYPVGVADLWDAVTTGERISRWLMPITGELRIGGRYQLQGNAGGVVEECVPTERIAVTWEYGGDVSWVVATLSGGDDQSSLTVVHTAHVDDERWAEFGPGAVGIGWDMMLLGLSLYLESSTSLEPAEAAAWTMSPEGKQVMTESGTAWRDAQIASGDDEDAARAASERCIAAYTGG
jgi:uncharacterized protein YndB with AHSA1/START domain